MEDTDSGALESTVLAGKSRLGASPTNSALSDVTLSAGTEQWREYLQHRNHHTLQIKVYRPHPIELVIKHLPAHHCSRIPVTLDEHAWGSGTIQRSSVTGTGNGGQ